MDSEKPFHIYGLFDPRDGAIKYIGRTNNMKGRLSSHMSRAVNVGKSRWITELERVGMRPEMVILETVATMDEAKEVERQWIEKCFTAGADLTNRIYPGCEGMNKGGSRGTGYRH